MADSSVAVDSGEVLETFAAESIPVYWIVNIPEAVVSRSTESRPARRTHRPIANVGFMSPASGFPLSSTAGKSAPIDVSEILP